MMRLPHFSYFIIFAIFICIPFILFYFAFFSGNTDFKNSVNNFTEFYYFIFVTSALLFSAFITKFFLDRNKIDKNKKVLLLFIFKIIVAVYAILLVLICTSRFYTYRSEAIDVMFFKQAIWMISEFKIPEFAWSLHFSPILIFLAPFFWLNKSGTILMFVQAVFVVSAVIPLYLVVKDKLKSQILGLALAFAYLTFGGLQFGFAYGFHEIMFFPTLFFWAYYFLIKKRIKLYFLFVLLCLTVKEEVSFVMIFWGLYLVYKKNYLPAVLTIMLGIFWYVLCFHIVIPYFNKGGTYGFWGQYPGAENGITGIISTALFQPIEFLKMMLTPKYKVDTILHSFGHFSFISFLYPPSLIPVVPPLLQKLLSSGIAAKNGFHYSAVITAVIAVSVIESVFSLQRKKMFNIFIKNRNAFLGIIIIYTAFCANVLYGYHPISPLLLGREGGLTEQQVMILNRSIDAIPSGASVAAQYYIRSHINKPYRQTFDGPHDNESADYAVIHTDLPLVMSERDYLENDVSKIIKEGKYEVIFNNSGTIVLKKK